MSYAAYTRVRETGDVDSGSVATFSNSQEEVEVEGALRRLEIPDDQKLRVAPYFCDKNGKPIADGGSFVVQLIRIEPACEPPLIADETGYRKVKNLSSETFDQATDGVFDLRVVAASAKNGTTMYYRLDVSLTQV